MEQIKNQFHTDNYSIYCGDSMSVLPQIPDESIDHSVYSPPFAGLYNYSSSEYDFSNCESKEQFLQMYDFLIKEMSRVTKKGRINAVHVTEIVDNNGSSWDFPNEVIRLHEKHGFQYKGRITVWKEPLGVRMRTMVKSLMHKLIVEDSSQCFVAQPDYILIFKKKGESEIPVTHPFGLTHYAGATPVLPHMLQAFNNANQTKFNSTQLWDYLKRDFYDHKDPKTNKLSHYIWQRYASSVWDDIRINEVLQFKTSNNKKLNEDDEKHVHPLQLDVIDRCVELYSNPN